MGYYYSIFWDLVDTSTLQLQVVDGSWGYRSAQFLCKMRTLYLNPEVPKEAGVLVFRRCDQHHLDALLQHPNGDHTRCTELT